MGHPSREKGLVESQKGGGRNDSQPPKVEGDYLV